MAETSSVIVFDGVCLLCNRWVDFILRHDHVGRFQLAAMQGTHGRRLLSEHGLSPDDPMSFLLVQDGRGHANTDAVIHVLRGLGHRWNVMSGVLRVVPGFLRDPAYRWIARHRYRLFGRRDRCRLPDAAHASRFLD